MASPRWTSWFKAFLALTLWASAFTWNRAVFNSREALLERFKPVPVVLPRPEVARIGALGFQSVLADGFLLGALQYFGGHIYERQCYPQLPDYLKLVTELDPHLLGLYHFGGAALPCNGPNGWVHGQEAADLLERGATEFPDDLQIRITLAYVDSSLLGRYAEAGSQLKAAALIPGAPSYVAGLATRMFVTSGRTEAAIAVAEDLLAHTQDEKVRSQMTSRIEQLRAKAAEERISAAIQEFRGARGRLPASIEELGDPALVTLGKAEAVVYSPATGEVHSARASQYLGVFDPDREKREREKK